MNQNSKFQFSLSLSNAKGIPFNEYEKNFRFIVNGKSYETNRYIADLISPIIRKYHHSDKTIDEFTINTESDIQLMHEDCFKDFLNLATFENYEIDSNQQKLFAQYFLHLGNLDEFHRLEHEYQANLTPNNAVDHLKSFNNFEYSSETSLSNLKQTISYSASHFTEINKDELQTLNEEIIEEIIKSDSLQLDEEDTLLQFILDLYEKDPKYSPLFEYVIFNNIKQVTFEKFLNKFSINDLNLGIWLSIFKRPPSEKIQTNSKRYIEKKQIQIEFKKGEELNGILNYLNKKTGGNIHDNGTIEITSNSIFSPDRHPKNLIDYQGSTLYHSKEESDVNVCFDFKEKKIQLESYTIKSYMCGRNTNHLREWVVEGSNDGQNWTVIDRRENERKLNGSFAVATFDVNETADFYRFIRLKQTGLNWMNKKLTILHSLEMHGTILLA